MEIIFLGNFKFHFKNFWLAVLAQHLEGQYLPIGLNVLTSL